jgi:hypothetical protein
MQVAADPTVSQEPVAAPVLCPRCGYDLRGTTADRCSECGQEIDRAALAESGVPWAHRRKLGRVRTFLSTVWLVSIDSKRIRHELSKPQDLSAARRFRAILVVLLTLIGLGALATVIFDNGAENLLLQPARSGDAGLAAGMASYFPTPMAGWQQDLKVPWYAGVSITWLLPAYVLLLAVFITGIAASAIHVPRVDRECRRAADSVALYAGACLLWLAIPAAAYFAAHEANVINWRTSDGGDFNLMRTRNVLQLVAWVSAGIVLLLALRRSGQWITRAHHAGIFRFLLSILECIFRFAVGILVCGGVIPWCCGLIRIAADRMQ